MERNLMTSLIAWKGSDNRKPLLLRGARQTGKTWLVEHFGASEFHSMVKIDFMFNPQAASIFDVDLDPNRIIREIELRAGLEIDPENTLIYFDEIQEAPRGITALKYFCEQAREYHVIATGSYMGISLGRAGESFPVGKVDELVLNPLSFAEFLKAVAGKPLANALQQADMRTLASVSDILEQHLKEYLVVGGMPEVVASYATSHDLNKARHLQQLILSAYDADFSKHAPGRILERMRLAWASIPHQLSQENKRFVYSAVRKGARARDFEESIRWLVDYGAVRKVDRASALRLPLASYQDPNAFKLFGLDVGLMSAQAELGPQAVLDGNRLFTEFKGALTEQYVCQELQCAGFSPTYWSAEKGQAETDFAVSLGARVAPIEVKAGLNLRSKSLKVAMEKFDLERGVRTSLAGYRDDGWVVNVPLWAISQVGKLF